MADILLWYVALQVLGFLAWPLAYSFFSPLPDRGYAASKALGLLLMGYLLWIVAQGGMVLPNSRGTTLVVLWALGLLSLWLVGKQGPEMRRFMSSHRGYLLWVEGLFLGGFLFWTLVRFFDPAITGTEKPMDFAFFNASWRSPSLPPQDPWLSGHTVSYYYFGYLIMAAVNRLVGSYPAVGYNLALAALLGLTLVGAFGIVSNVVQRLGGTAFQARLYGLIGAGLLSLLGTMEGLLEFLHSRGWGSMAFWEGIGIKDLSRPYGSTAWYPTDPWWWWRATRVIGHIVEGKSLDYTITEFPFFSFLLGDLHPHVMALPFALLVVTACLRVLVQPLRLVGRPWGSWLAEGALLALMLGAMGFLNSWDLPTYGVLFLGSNLLGLAWEHRQSNQRLSLREGIPTGAVLLGAAMLYLPFYGGFQSQAEGILPWLGPSTRPLHLLLLWGPFLFVASVFLAVVARSYLGEGRGLARVLLVIPWGFWVILEGVNRFDGPKAFFLHSVMQRLWPLLPITATVLLLQGALRRTGTAAPTQETPRVLSWVLLVLLLAWGLLLVPEWAFIKDVFGNRMNTMFKLGYQAWVLLALASAAALFWIGHRWHPRHRVEQGSKLVVGVASLLLLGGSLYYSVAALWGKAFSQRGLYTLDGLAYLLRAQPEEYQALRWLNESVPGTPVILEAVGGEYSDLGRVSAATGLPTLLGWAGHQRQWRGSDRPYAGRQEAVERLYRTLDEGETRGLLRSFEVRYVYVGAPERSRYAPEALAKFDRLLELAFQRGPVTIYRVPEDIVP